jgi:rSAM-associated Gly-rich repeat protein
MANRSLLQLLTLTAAAAVFSETAQARVFQEPDLSNPLEERIQTLRQGTWLGELNTDSANNEQLAHSWRNGGGHRWGNGSNRWRNGGGHWGNGGRYYYGGGGIHLNLGWPNGGWGNGGWGNVIPRGFFNW